MVYNVIYSMYTFCFYFCIHCIVLTPQNLVSICYHTKKMIYFFLGPHPQHKEVPMLGAGLCDLHHSSWILNPLSNARDRTLIFMDSGRVRFCCATVGNSKTDSFFFCLFLHTCGHVEVPRFPGVELEL